jgi:hypothetical protein
MTIKDGEELLWSDETPGVEDMEGQLLIADFAKFDADPTSYSNVGRLEVLSERTAAKERLLGSGRRGDPDGDVSVVMMIVGEHSEDLFIDEKRRFAVREPFGCGGKRGADLAYATEMFAVVDQGLC